jgi:hypothetical protein
MVVAFSILKCNQPKTPFSRTPNPYLVPSVQQPSFSVSLTQILPIFIAKWQQISPELSAVSVCCHEDTSRTLQEHRRWLDAADVYLAPAHEKVLEVMSGLLKSLEEDLWLKRVRLEDRARYLDAKHKAGSANAVPFYHPYGRSHQTIKIWI